MSHAYGIGVITVIVALSAVVVSYTSFYLPEQMAKPSVSHEILEAEIYNIEIVPGAVNDNDIDYVPKKAKVILGVDNHVVWVNNDDTAHTVTPAHRYTDSYNGAFESDGVILPGETYEFVFTEPAEIHYQCLPHPWMQATITIEKNRF